MARDPKDTAFGFDVRTELLERFKDTVPDGMNIRKVGEILLNLWIALPDSARKDLLINPDSVQGYVAGMISALSGKRKSGGAKAG